MNIETRKKISEALSGRKQSQEHIQKRIALLLGKKRTEEQKKKISISRKGIRLTKEAILQRTETRRKNGWNKNPIETSKRMSENNARANLGKKRTIEARIKTSLALTGENNPNWQGGKEPENNRIRKSLKYQLWRQSILKRDDYTCQICKKYGGKLQVDHIKPFALFRKLRFELSNGRTLCIPCHRKTDTHGYRKMYRKKINYLSEL